MTYDSQGYRLNDDGTRMTEGQVASSNIASNPLAVAGLISAPAAASPIVVAPNSAADESIASTSSGGAFEPGGALYNPPGSGNSLQENRFMARQALAQQALNLRAQQADIGNALREHADALATTRANVENAKTFASMQHEMRKNNDAAAFLQKLSKLDPTSPTYEKDIVAISAQHPFGGEHGSVKEMLGQLHTVRGTMLKAAEAGGMHQFTEGPARDTFVQTLNKTGDPFAATAQAKTVAANEKQLNTLREKGLLTDADFPHWDGSGSPPPIYTPDGTGINYSHAFWLASQRGAERANQAQSVATDKIAREKQNAVLGELKDLGIPLSAMENPEGWQKREDGKWFVPVIQGKGRDAKQGYVTLDPTHYKRLQQSYNQLFRKAAPKNEAAPAATTSAESYF